MDAEHSLPLVGPPGPDPSRLLDAVAGHTLRMAEVVYDAFALGSPAPPDRSQFVIEAARRLETLLAVVEAGAAGDPDLDADLHLVGAGAARSGASLPELLAILRISRDVVVRTAVTLADPAERTGASLALLLNRIVPATDAMTDSIARGYWAAVVAREAENLARYEHFAANSSNGVYEVDLDGRLIFANKALALVLGRRRRELEGADLASVLRPLDPSEPLEDLLTDHGEAGHHQTLVICRPDGVRRVLSIYSTARLVDGEVVGFQGVVRDETAEREFETDRQRFTTLLTEELRGPLAQVVGLASTLQSHSDELSTDQMQRIGRSIRLHAERISRLSDDLHAVAQIEGGTLRLTVRPVELAAVVEAALASVRRGDEVEVAVGPGITVLVDPRRMEQIVGNLVDNAVLHGQPPVAITAEQRGDEVLMVVTDHGAGVASASLANLWLDPPGGRMGGGGLPLVRGLSEAMGGRVWCERTADESRFCLTLPAPSRGL